MLLFFPVRKGYINISNKMWFDVSANLIKQHLTVRKWVIVASRATSWWEVGVWISAG